MPEYFSNLPTINYNGINSINITNRATLLDNYKLNASNFYPYTIQENQTADSIAYDYYGDPNYVWIIYYTNNIIDPYYDWPLFQPDFDNYITSKYGSVANAQNQIAYWQQNTVQYYADIYSNQFIPASQYDQLSYPTFVPITSNNVIKIQYWQETSNSTPGSSWSSVDCYTDEINRNEQKKNILLLDRTLVPSIQKQLESMFNG